jgi:hypothetical protein
LADADADEGEEEDEVDDKDERMSYALHFSRNDDLHSFDKAKERLASTCVILVFLLLQTLKALFKLSSMLDSLCFCIYRFLCDMLDSLL